MGPKVRRLGVVAIVTAFIAALVFVWVGYSGISKAFARAERMHATASAVYSVLELLLDQENGIRGFSSTHEAALLAPYLRARRTFDASVADVGSQLEAFGLHGVKASLDDLRTAYAAWLTSVARPLAYKHLHRSAATMLLLRGTMLVDRMRLDAAAVLAGVDEAATAEVSRAQRDLLLTIVAAVLFIGLVTIIALVIERRQTAIESEWSRFFDTVEDLLCVADYNGHVVRTNNAWQRALGYAAHDLDTRSFLDLVHPDDRGATALEMYRLARNERVTGFRNRYRAKDGTYRLMIWNAVPDASRHLVYVSARDETDHVKIESELAELSFADHLTGLPNRRHFVQQLHRAINMAQRHRLTFWVLYFDLDALKEINDTMGHAAGDDALKGMVANIAARLRESDIFARVGGDEFAILTPPIALPWDVEAMAHKIVDAASLPVDVGGRSMRLGISLGIAGFPEDGNTANGVLAAADNAMYAAKRSGGSTFVRYKAYLGQPAQVPERPERRA